MKLIDQLNCKPFFVAFGQAMSGSGITSVDLVANRNSTAVTLTASDGSAAAIPGADTTNAGVMTLADKIKLDSLAGAGTHAFASRARVPRSGMESSKHCRLQNGRRRRRRALCPQGVVADA